VTVRHNRAQSRYELDTEHGMAVAVYSIRGDEALFTHTEVPRQDEGKGLASQLVRAALDDTKQRGLKIVPVCSFVVAFVRRHPEYGDGRT
jgi:predicted GNAT family acetyltransferase